MTTHKEMPPRIEVQSHAPLKTSRISVAAKLLSRAWAVTREEGIFYLAGKSLALLAVEAQCTYYRVLKLGRTFTFRGKTYPYFCHIYNRTWQSERAIEIPIVSEFLNRHQGDRILEVGNVLSHYYLVNDDIVDKFELGDGVTNEDIVSYRSAGKYDLIVSISTLEHVGWDETPREPMKVLAALENMKRLLKDGGEILVTLPVGYNLELDRLLKQGAIKFSEFYCFKRTARYTWTEAHWSDIENITYDHPFPYANGLVIGVITQETGREISSLTAEHTQ